MDEKKEIQGAQAALTDKMAELGLRPAPLPDEIMDSLPPDLAAAMRSGEGLAFPLGSGRGAAGLLDMLGDILGFDTQDTTLENCDDLAFAVFKQLAQTVTFILPAVREIGRAGVERSMDGYTDAINEHLLVAAEAIMEVVRTAEMGIRQRSLDGMPFGVSPLQAAEQQLDAIIDRVEPYTDKHGGAALLSILTPISVKSVLAMYADCYATIGELLRKLRATDPEAAARATANYASQAEQLLRIYDEARGPLPEVNQPNVFRTRDNMLDEYPRLRAGGLLPRDAAIRAFGGEDRLHNAIEAYPLKDLAEIPADTRVMMWQLRVNGGPQAQEGLQSNFHDAIQSLALILDMAAAHGEDTLKLARGGLRDIVDDYLPEAQRGLKTSLTQGEDAIQRQQQAVTDAAEASFKSWDATCEAMDQNAMLSQMGNHDIESFVNAFGKLESVSLSFLQALETIMLNKSDALDFAKKVMFPAFDRLPVATAEFLDGYTPDPTSKISTKYASVQQQYAAARGAGASGKQALVGAMLTGTLQMLDVFDEDGNGDGSDKLPESSTPDALPEGAGQPAAV